MKKQMTITLNVEVEIPTVPNFIKCGEQTLAISKFSNAELNTIGKEWTKNLIQKARQKS